MSNEHAKRLREVCLELTRRGQSDLACDISPAADALDALEADRDNHCRDCCCAQSWKALGITEYTGKSIPEHIDQLRARIAELEAANGKLRELLRVEHGMRNGDFPWVGRAEYEAVSDAKAHNAAVSEALEE